MMYVKRDGAGKLIGFSNQPHPEMLEEVPDNDPELLAFMAPPTEEQVAARRFDDKLVKALVLEFLAELTALASKVPGYAAPTPAQFRQRVIDGYKLKP